MDYDNFKLKDEIDILYNQLTKSAATFVLKPNEIKQIKQNIFELQNKCNHKFENGKCIYCRKEE